MKSLLATNQRDERWYGRGWSHQQRDIEDFPENLRDLYVIQAYICPCSSMPAHTSALRKPLQVTCAPQATLSCSPSKCQGWLPTCVHSCPYSSDCGIVSLCPLSRPPHFTLSNVIPSVRHALIHAHITVYVHPTLLPFVGLYKPTSLCRFAPS